MPPPPAIVSSDYRGVDSKSRSSFNSVTSFAQESHPFPWKKIAIGVMVIVANLLIMEAAARFFAFLDQPVLSNNVFFDEKFFLMRHLDYSQRKNIVILGDSAMGRAVYPDLLASELAKNDINVNVVNLAINGGSPTLAVKLLDAAIQTKQLKPDLVICNFRGLRGLVNSTNESFGENKEQLKSLDKSYVGRCVLCKRKRTIAGLICMLEDYSYLLRNRAYFKTRITEFIEAAANPRTFEWKTTKSFSDGVSTPSNLGWTPNHFILTPASYAEMLSRSPLAVEDYKRLSEKLKDGRAKVTLAYSGELQAYCKEHHIPLCIVQIPYCAPFMNKYLFSAQYTPQMHSTNLRAASSPKDGLYVAEVTGLNDELAHFNDMFAHLSTYGGIECTKKLADILSKEPYRSMCKSSQKEAAK